MATTFVRQLALTGALVLTATASSVAPAQAQSVYGYVFGAPGAVTCCGQSEGTLHAGGGGEFITSTGIGVGAEIGFLGPRDAFEDGLGVLSLDGAYHFGPATSKLRPFVTGGYCCSSATERPTCGTSAAACSTGSAMGWRSGSSSVTTSRPRATRPRTSGACALA